MAARTEALPRASLLDAAILRPSMRSGGSDASLSNASANMASSSQFRARSIADQHKRLPVQSHSRQASIQEDPFPHRPSIGRLPQETRDPGLLRKSPKDALRRPRINELDR